jgi:hypothetical protein
MAPRYRSSQRAQNFRLNMKLHPKIILIVLLGVMATAEQWPFQNYPAVVSKHKPAPLKLETAKAKQHITAIRKAVRRGPNFAGHYTVAGWGSGTEVAVYVIVDDSTGRVYEPPEISISVDLGLGDAEPAFRVDSSLMVLASCLDARVYGLKNCRRNFYRWDGSQLILLSSEPVTATPNGQ